MLLAGNLLPCHSARRVQDLIAHLHRGLGFRVDETTSFHHGTNSIVLSESELLHSLVRQTVAALQGLVCIHEGCDLALGQPAGPQSWPGDDLSLALLAC